MSLFIFSYQNKLLIPAIALRVLSRGGLCYDNFCFFIYIYNINLELIEDENRFTERNQR
jgi:hypothetical protein